MLVTNLAFLSPKFPTFQRERRTTKLAPMVTNFGRIFYNPLVKCQWHIFNGKFCHQQNGTSMSRNSWRQRWYSNDLFFQISLKKFKSRKTRWDKIRMTNILLFVYLVYLFYFNFKNFCYHVKYFLSQIYNCCASKGKLIISNKQFSAASINNQLNISNKYWGRTSAPKI